MHWKCDKNAQLFALKNSNIFQLPYEKREFRYQQGKRFTGFYQVETVDNIFEMMTILNNFNAFMQCRLVYLLDFDFTFFLA